MNESKRQARVAALLREREGVARRDPKDDRIAQIDEQLAYYGYETETAPSKPARKKRPAKKASSR